MSDFVRFLSSSFVLSNIHHSSLLFHRHVGRDELFAGLLELGKADPTIAILVNL
jgi:hypothetical protein